MKAHYGFCFTVLAAACALVILDGCASTSFEGITTGSKLYDARIAANAGASQSKTSACEAKARSFWSANANDEFVGVKAGKVFETCVRS